MQDIGELEQYLAEITGFHAVSLQPNSGAAGEYRIDGDPSVPHKPRRKPP
jgi:hypothetical protein